MNQERLDRIFAAMKENDMPQLIISDPMMVYYLTGAKLRSGERMQVILLKDDGTATIFANDLFPNITKLGLPVVFHNDVDDAVEQLNSYMYQGKTIAIDKNWPARFVLRLQELNSGKTVNSSFIVDYVLQIKSPAEQELMIKSSLINDTVVGRVIEIVGKGYDELEMQERTRAIYAEEGCEGTSFTPIIAFEKNAADPHHGADHSKGKRGDCVVIDIGGMKDGYASDITRTVFLGEMSARQKEIYDIVLEANLRGIAAAKPGARMCDVDNAARGYITEKGFGQYFTHRTGHSIGIEDHEYGDVSSVNTDIIKPGQCFSVEPGIYIPEEGIGVRIEDLVLVTEDGCEILNHVSKELTILK